MKAFWLFIRNTNTGTGTGGNAPAWPAGVGGQSVTPGDVIRITGPAGPNDHRHLVVGGIALPDDNAGDGHRHYLAKLGANWTVVTVGAANHTHTLPVDVNGNLMPEYFLTFWAGSDADAATIAASPDCFPVVEAVVTFDQDGNPQFGGLDNTAWTAGVKATWQARCLNLLGVTLPAEIDRGKRLVLLFLGALLSRQMSNEAAYRFVTGSASAAPEAEVSRLGLSTDEQAARAPTVAIPTVAVLGRQVIAGRIIPAYTTTIGERIWDAMPETWRSRITGA